MINSLKSNDSTYQALCQKAFLECQNEQLQDAISTCQKAIQKYPTLPDAHVILGNALQLIGNFEQAIQSYSQALAINSNLPTVYANFANIYLKQGQLELAKENCQKALEIEPKLAIANWNLGHIFNEEDQFDKAVVYWEKALEIKPDIASLEFYNHLCQILISKNKLELATSFYIKALQVNPNNTDIYQALGNLLEQQGNSHQAISYYIQALQIQPSLRSAYSYIGKILEKQGRFNEAKMCSTVRLPTSVLQEFYPTSQNFSVLSTLKADSVQVISVLEDFSNIQYHLSAGKTVNQTIHDNLKQNDIKSPDNFVVLLQNGRAWGDFYTSAILTEDNQLLEDISTGSFTLIASSQKLPPVHKIEGRVAFLTVRGVASYYHWMCDVLPRFELIRKAGFSCDSIDFFVLNGCDYSFCKQTLDILGIPEEKILDSKNFPHIQAQELVIPSLPYGALSQWIVDYLRSIFLKKLNQSNDNIIPKIERLYISRCRADFRRIINENEVLTCLDQFGFKAVILEALPFIEQVSLLASAEVVIAPHGAGLTNLAFCQPGTKVIEIFSPNYVNNCFWLISNHAHLDYYYLIGENLENYNYKDNINQPKYLHPGTEDILVKTDEILKIINIAGITPKVANFNSSDNFEDKCIVNQVNLIIFPDWNQPEDLIYQDLATVISVLCKHPDKSLIHLWIDSTDIDEQDAHLFISSMMMSLLMEAELEIDEEPQISIIGALNNIEWESFISNIKGRIQLSYENQSAISNRKVESILILKIANLSNYRFITSF